MMNIRNLRDSTACPRILCLVLFLLVAGAADTDDTSDPDELLKKYRTCIADARGGTYWAQYLSSITCHFAWSDGEQVVRCEWHSGGSVVATFRLEDTASSSANGSLQTTPEPPPRAYCKRALRIETANYEETFSADFDTEKNLPQLVRGPDAYLKWRDWMQYSSLLRVTIRDILDDVPSFADFPKLHSFAISDSAQYFPIRRDNKTNSRKFIFPKLPFTIEDVSFAGNKLIEIPDPEDNPLLSLRRLDLSHNRLGSWFGILREPLAPNLEELDLSHNVMETVGTDLPQWFPKIKWLDISHNRITRYPWAPSGNVKIVIPNTLTFLNFSYNTGRDQSFPMYFGTMLPSLETLDVSYTRPTYTQNETLTWNFFFPWAIKRPKLKRLYISGFDNIDIIANASFEYVKMKMEHQKFPVILNSKIKYLDLSESKLNYISNLSSKNTTVEYLDLANNNITHWESETIFQNQEGTAWVQNINLRDNNIRFMLPQMLRSLEGLKTVDIDSNPFECNNCAVYDFQIWLKENSRKIRSLNKSLTSPYCGSPEAMRNTLVVETDFYWKFCVLDPPVVGGLSAGLVLLFIAMQVLIVYRFRHKLVFIQHMYRLRVRRPKDEAGDCTHDVFICYCSADRSFVMNTLAPFLEGGPERYRAYIHERSFTLGSDINANIVEAIERSRRALLVVTQAFLRSEYCKKEFDMVTHRAFDGNAGYMVLLRYGPLRKEMLPRPLRLYMTTKTYLEWPDDPRQMDNMEVRKRLVTALGRSLYQREQTKVCGIQSKEEESAKSCEHLTPDVTVAQGNSFMHLFRR